MANRVVHLECLRCNETKPEDEFHVDRSRKTERCWCCKDCMKQQNAKNYQSRRATSREHYRSMRKQLLELYGGECACCGEDTPIFLAVDHVDGHGGEDRDRFPNTYSYYQYLLDHRRDGYRVLCHNCNWATAWGTCPHQEKR